MPHGNDQHQHQQSPRIPPEPLVDNRRFSNSNVYTSNGHEYTAGGNRSGGGLPLNNLQNYVNQTPGGGGSGAASRRLATNGNGTPQMMHGHKQADTGMRCECRRWHVGYCLRTKREADTLFQPFPVSRARLGRVCRSSERRVISFNSPVICLSCIDVPRVASLLEAFSAASHGSAMARHRLIERSCHQFSCKSEKCERCQNDVFGKKKS